MGHTTRDDIRAWLDAAKAKGATHMIVACGTFVDYNDFPVEVPPGQDVAKVLAEHQSREGMLSAMECYSFVCNHPIESQLLEHRAHHERCPRASEIVPAEIPDGINCGCERCCADPKRRPHLERIGLAAKRQTYRPPSVKSAPRYTETEARLRLLLRDIADRFEHGASVDLDGLTLRIREELGA